jgi:flagellar hook assembly protein FlgD
LYKGNFYKGYKPITDFAVWIEDENHNYIKTLQISKGAVNVVSTGVHAEHLPTWLKSSKVKTDLKVANDSLAYVLPEFDGVTSASLKVSATKDTTIGLTWNFTDVSGKSVPEGTYYYCIEVSNIKKDSSAAPGDIPVTILSESTRGTIITRQRISSDGVSTNNIKSLKIAVAPLGSVSATTDATTSATK